MRRLIDVIFGAGRGLAFMMIVLTILLGGALWLLADEFRTPFRDIVHNAVITVAAAVGFSVFRYFYLTNTADIDTQLKRARETLQAPDDILAADLRRVRWYGGGDAVTIPHDPADGPEVAAGEQDFPDTSDSVKISLLRTEFARTKVQPAWDVARTTLEKYWARNLNQNAFIFITSIIASGFGFAVTLWGVYAAIYNQAPLGASILAAASGAVTQIIGTTFLVIYRSTAQQALEFNRTLERINSVGMAWYVLQTMSEETDAHRKAKDAAKAALVLSVVAAGGNAAVLVESDKSDASASNEKK